MRVRSLNVRCPALSATLLAAALLAPLAAPAQVAGFVPNEVQASTRKDLLDSEFSQSRNMFTWCDNKGRLWVGTIDPVTGNILTPTYKMLDSNAILPSEMSITTNGPEWVSTATGDHIVYTKFVTDPAKASSARLALVEGSADGSTWGAPVLLGPDAGRNAPYASEDDGDANPRISYVDAKNNHYWRYLYDAASELPVKGMSRTPKPVSVRFVKGANALVYSQDVNGTNQVFRVALDTNKRSQITNDSGSKDVRTVPWMWRAPDYGNALVLMTTVDERELRFYRDNGSGTFSVINSIMLPEGSTVTSPEPFVYQGKSYVSLGVKALPYTYPTSIWIAAVAPNSSPQFWKVSDDSDGHERIDPEVYITSGNGVVVFYNKFDPSLDPTGTQPSCAACSEGLFRASTGLGTAF